MPRPLPASPRAVNRPAVLLAVVATVLALFVGRPDRALAYTYLPARPTGMHVAATTSSSLTIAWKRSTHARRYEVIASIVRSDVYLANLSHASSHRYRVTGRSPRLTLAHLPYSTHPYYYRVAAINRTRVRWAMSYPAAYLRPPAPSALVARLTGGLHLGWRHGTAAGYVIEQARNSSFTRSVRSYRIRVNQGTFAPYATTRGAAYWFRVRAVNGHAYSRWSAAAHVASAPGRVALQVATYNTLSSTFDGTMEEGNRVAPWSQRGPAVASLIREINPAVIAVEEAGSYVNTANKTRQIDSIVSLLGRSYRLADTTSGPTRTGRFTDSYIVYQPTKVTPVGNGGHWAIDTNRYAVYQVLRTVSTRQQFLFVSVHVTSGKGRTYDQLRERQTASLVRQAASYASQRGVSAIVYGGDFNSYPGRSGTTDTPTTVFNSVHASDALRVAQTTAYARYNSMNGYQRTPPHGAGCIDHVFTSVGVGVASWREWLRLSHGRVVGVIPSDHNPVSSVVEL